MKKTVSLLLTLLLLSALCLTAFAARTSSAPLIVDDAGLLTEDEEAKLTALAEEISARQSCDVAVLLVYGTEGKALQDYTDDFFFYRGYGYGNEADGVMLSIDMQDRAWHIATHGWGITAITDYGIDYIFDALADDLSNGEYYDAFETYLKTTDELLTMAHNGTPLDVTDEPVTRRAPTTGSYIRVSVIALVIGLLGSAIPMAGLKAQIKNVRKNQAASPYVRNNSLRLFVNRDIFLYANTTSRRIETERSSGHSGGSHTHTSSSGSTFGGHGGHF